MDGKGTKLMKGQIYDAILVSAPDSKFGTFSRIELYNGDIYNGVCKFENLDGTNLGNTHIDERDEVDELHNLEINANNITTEELQQAYVKYIGGNASKYFVTGKIYKVGAVNDYTPPYTIRLKGFGDNWLDSGNFSLLSSKELRELKIDLINDEENIITKFTRKFDDISTHDKFKVLMNLLLRTREEFNKNDFKGINTAEFMIDSDHKYGITLEDIEEFKKIKIIDLFTQT